MCVSVSLNVSMMLMGLIMYLFLSALIQYKCCHFFLHVLFFFPRPNPSSCTISPLCVSVSHSVVLVQGAD